MLVLVVLVMVVRVVLLASIVLIVLVGHRGLRVIFRVCMVLSFTVLAEFVKFSHLWMDDCAFQTPYEHLLVKLVIHPQNATG